MKTLILLLIAISFSAQAISIESEIKNYLDSNCTESLQSGISYSIKNVELIESDGHQAEYRVTLDLTDDYDHSPGQKVEIEIRKELMFGKIRSLTSLDFCQ